MSRKNGAIKLKLEKANMLLQEVPVLIQFKYHATAINRMYFSCFNATKALLLTKDAIPKTHSGVIKMLHDLFVKTGEFDKSLSDFFSKLMQQRIEFDYDDQLPLERDDIGDYYEQTKQYIARIESLINL